MTDSLLSRLEALTEPSREFDALIWAEQDNREAIDDYTCDIWIEDKQIKACGPTPAIALLIAIYRAKEGT